MKNAVKNPIVQQMMGIISLVISITMMTPILDQFDAWGAISGFSDLPILPEIYVFFPALIYLGLITLGELLTLKGANTLDKSNPIMGVAMNLIGLIIFISMFGVIITSSVTLNSRVGLSIYTLMTTLVGIVPTVLFLGGIFQFGWLAYRSYKSDGKKKAAAAATA